VIVALAGGVGAAKLLAGLVTVVDPSEVTAVVNTGDDLELHGLHISPDIDSVTYALAGLDNKATGWGVVDETWTVAENLKAIGGAAWFQLGDRDLATHLFRTQRLSEGATLSEVTAELTAARGVRAHLVPMSDQPVRTRVTLAEPPPGEAREVAFQDYFVRLGHALPVSSVRFSGAEAARPAPGVLEAMAAAEVVVCCPSNPVVSIGPILAVPGILHALQERRDRVVGVSPIVAGTALRGPADRLLRELGHEVSALGVARLYAPWVGTLVIDEADESLAGAIEALGVRCVVAATVMTDTARAADLAKAVLGAV
jgi:LPPG:FO 2-phospho-L-lactate transferase